MFRFFFSFRKDMPDYVWDEYAESVPMSTYLLAFAVTDFKSLGAESFRVWTRPDALRSAEYSLEIGPKILKCYEEFFGIPYPLPKVDMIALPDFTAGGKHKHKHNEMIIIRIIL